MDQQTWIITFSDDSPDKASRHASQLKAMLLDASPDIKVTQKPSGEYTQDWGDTLVAILATEAAVAAVKAIATWITSSFGRSIKLKTPNFEFQSKGLNGKDYDATLERLLNCLSESKGEEK